jgi:MOSC domain
VVDALDIGARPDAYGLDYVTILGGRYRPDERGEPAFIIECVIDGHFQLVDLVAATLDHTLAIGTAVRLKITSPCGRCVMTTLAQGDLPKDPGILRAAAQHNQVNVGVYAAVEQGGTIRRGDPVRIE